MRIITYPLSLLRRFFFPSPSPAKRKRWTSDYQPRFGDVDVREKPNWTYPASDYRPKRSKPPVVPAPTPIIPDPLEIVHLRRFYRAAKAMGWPPEAALGWATA